MLLVGTTGGVFKVNYIPKRLPAIQSSDLEHVKSIVGTPWDPAPGRQARVLDVSPSRRQKPLLQRRSCFHEIPNRENQKPVQDDSTFDETVNYICTDTQTDAPGAMQRVRDEPHSLEGRSWFASAILSEESDEIRRRFEETQRRREAAGVPLELRPGRVEELPPAKGAESDT